LGASAASAPVLLRILRSIGSRQTVSEHVPEHAAKQGTPTMGGLVVLVGLMVGLAAQRSLSPALALLVGGFGLVGFLDDFVVPRAMPGKRGLGWVPKLALQCGSAAGAALLAGYAGGGAALAAFVLLYASNAYNFADGLDWLAGMLAILLAAGLGAVGWVAGRAEVLVPVALLCVSLIPFLVLNRPPAKIFMGDVGALPIGALLGWVTLQVAMPPGRPPASAGVIGATVLAHTVLLIEIVPVPLQIASAKLRKGKRLFPFRTPVHHAFQHAGWPETRVVALFAATQAAASLAAYFVAGGAR
jgi:phospho-N-acetylmuramoyl-pentapeptide-transferase